MIETVIEESADILTELVERASEFGYLTTDDIVQLFPQAEESPTLLEEMIARIICLSLAMLCLTYHIYR